MVKKDFSKFKELYPFKSHFFKINDYNYHYVDEGKGEPFLMVHGNPSWSFMYRELIKEFSKTQRVIAPDHLGFGLSDKPEKFPYRLETHIDNLEAFIVGLNLTNITLLIHDWGGPIGLGVAVRYPERIKRIIITNTAAFSLKKIPRRIKLGRIPWLGEKLIKNLNFFAKAATVMTTVKPLSPIIKDAYLYPFRNKTDRMGILRFVQDIPASPIHPSFEVLIAVEHGLWMFNSKPKAIIWGMRDWCFSPLFYEKWLGVYPDMEHCTLDNAGHWLFEDEPEKIIDFIHSFIANSP
jgi:haloalkane dehalogenase